MPRTKPPRADKVEVVGTIEDLLTRSQAAIVTEYRGLTVSEMTELRNRLRPGGGEYHVVKNTLIKRALGDKVSPELDSMLKGPSAVAFATTDPIHTSKTLLAYLREIRKPEITLKGGYVDGRVYTVEQITALSKIPSREAVLAQAVGTIQAPLSNFVGTMNGILSEFARTLQAVADKQQAEGGAG
jgi:large subunit ribosomal protein L10